MPKGVYPRQAGTGKLRMVQVEQTPEHQTANAGIEASRQTSGDEDISTTEKLFGSELAQQELAEQQKDAVEVIDQSPREEQTEEPAQETPNVPESVLTPETPKPTESTPQDDFLDWDKMAGKKIRQKIDGKEVIVTAEELKKYSDQDQIKKHLAEAADKVGEERRKLAEERRQIQELRNRPVQEQPNQSNGNVQQQDPQDFSNPVFQRIQFLEEQVRQLAQGTQPVIFQSNRQRVANELNTQGFNDFMDYLPKMESHLMSVKDPGLVSFYDTPEGAKSLYFQLKAQDMQKAQTAPVRNVPQGTIQQTQVSRNPQPPAMQIDGGGQSSGSNVDDSGHLLRTAFRKATASGDRDAWNEVLRQKGIIQ